VHLNKVLPDTSAQEGDGFGETRDREIPWAESQQEMDHIWKERTAGELRRNLSRNPDGGIDAAREKIRKKYSMIEREISGKADAEIQEFFLSSACRAYDPHSDYLGPKSVEEFDISMGLKLCGIGAVLTSEDGVAKVESLLVGGPAAKSGEILKGDKILSIGQDGGAMEDIAGMPLSKVVDMIRGEEGTLVKIEVASGGEGAPSRVITLRREVVQLNDQAIKGAVWDSNGIRLGVMTIPSFYADGEGRSSARDASMIVSKFEEMGVDAMILDLRQDGGGVLDEAVRMAGLFVPGKTVVQIRNPTGNLVIKKAPAMRRTWKKPLVVLVDRHSASASEIFAGAIQDHGAGIVAGDSRTFGKGTVQMVMGLEDSPFLNFFSSNDRERGAVKITVQKFYRATGGSTQAKGVVSDIVIPSPTDHDDIGEDTLPQHMTFDRISSGDVKAGLGVDLKETLRLKSSHRVGNDERFAERIEYTKSTNRLRHVAMGAKDGEKDGDKDENEGVLAERGTIVNTVRGGGVEVLRGEIGSVYEGNPMPKLPDEKGDLSLEESIAIALDWIAVEKDGSLARVGAESGELNSPRF
jgi:carboxyl-terminal processing protease